MALRLRDVPAASGLRWLGDAFRLFKRRPVALTLMLVSFMVVVMALMMLPWVVGLPLIMMSPPLLSLGVMIAGQSALLDGPVHPRQFFEPLRGNPKRRNAVLMLCAAYGVSLSLIGWLCFAVGDDATRQLANILAGREGGADDPRKMGELMAQPAMRNAVSLFNLLVVLLSVPFWHAPALVHWGSQGVGQALFSSTLAMWRAKSAFVLYGLAWAGVSVLVGMFASLLLALLGIGAVGLTLALGVTLSTWTVFYVSVLFTFNDSFGGAAAAGAQDA